MWSADDSSTVNSSPSANDMEASVASLVPVRAVGGYPFNIFKHVTSSSVDAAMAVFSSVRVLCALRVETLDMPFLVRIRMTKFFSGILISSLVKISFKIEYLI